MANRLLRCLGMPVGALLAVAALSLAARAAFIGQPCRRPCRSAGHHFPVFDETYYVGAAHVIAGLRPPAREQYRDAPAGSDPNAEHPQLVKLLIATSIRLLGDGPLAWRWLSLVCGTAAIIGMYALARAAGAGAWEAVVAAALMAFDNLMIVHGRIATLDVPVLAAMVWAVALYLRRRPLMAGVTLGAGACVKLVAPYALLVVGAWELLSGAGASGDRMRRGLRLTTMTAAGGAVMLALLGLLGWLAPPYDLLAHRPVGGGPFGHLRYMLSYAAGQVSPHGPRGIASLPWGWPLDLGTIVYLYVDPAHPAAGLAGIRPPVHFLGMISPPILLLGVPGVGLAVWRCLRRPARGDLRPDGVQRLATAWFAGTFLPFAALSLFWQRTSYLYYMVVVMPALYLAAARLARIGWASHRRAVGAWAGTVVLAAMALYPFTPVP